QGCRVAPSKRDVEQVVHRMALPHRLGKRLRSVLLEGDEFVNEAERFRYMRLGILDGEQSSTCILPKRITHLCTTQLRGDNAFVFQHQAAKTIAARSAPHHFHRRTAIEHDHRMWLNSGTMRSSCSSRIWRTISAGSGKSSGTSNFGSASIRSNSFLRRSARSSGVSAV